MHKINYPGLPSDPGHKLHMSQARGGGSLVSFETGNVALSKAFSEHLKLFKVARTLPLPPPPPHTPTPTPTPTPNL